MPKFQLETPFQPTGDQPKAIEALSKGVKDGLRSQVLKGVTGSGKTFTMANVVQQVQKPTLVIAHNKTLAAQLYQEFKSFFPHNAVEYFVSYYDYYQPEAYIPRTDTYIEKDMAINDEIDRMRLSATRSLLEREDVLIVASVSCIYGLGSPEFFRKMHLELSTGKEVRRDDLLLHLVEMQYKRNDYDFSRGTFRVRGDLLEVFPAYEETAVRIELFDKEVERITSFDPLTGKTIARLDRIAIYPSSHHVTPEEVREEAVITIRQELRERLDFYEQEGRLLERERIQQRTAYDLEVIQEIGFCKGIENYSRHFSQRNPGEPPSCLIDYFPKDFLLFIDESHQTLPQIHAMCHGDRSRKLALVDFGFRLPSAYDNRPLTFHEAYARFNQVVYVSATPSPFEVSESGGKVVEQVIRPTGLLDPEVEIRKATGQVDNCLEEIRKHTEKGGRVLVTTLTKKLAEDLSRYLNDLNVKAKYLHSDIDTIERSAIIADLRAGTFDVLIGINLLREGLDIPEVSLVAVLDADKEGFLRSETSLIQTCGRAARNSEGRVILYADKITKSIQATIDTTEKRRAIQKAYNEAHGITPTTVIRSIKPLVSTPLEELNEEVPIENLFHHERMTAETIDKKIKALEKEMRKKAKELQFEDAGKLRDQIRALKQFEITS
jgi:excinuclease ABC subunit B